MRYHAGHNHSGAGNNAVPTGSLAKWAWLSICAAIVTILLKGGAYFLTGSVGLLSDALESFVNLAAAILALIAITVAAKPPDRNHHFGHGKAEYFSAGAEGLMIMLAAVLIGYSAIDRLLNPRPLEMLGIGLAITVVATLINGGVGLLLIRVGRRHRSITLVADGKHLMTDVWTSVGVLAGVGIVAISGWQPLDSIVAILVGLNILWTGFGLIRYSARGLMDHSLPPDDEKIVLTAIAECAQRHPDIDIHGVQMRESGRDRFVSLHVLVPGAWSVDQGHDVVEELEAAITNALDGSIVHTHLEPIEDPRAYEGLTGTADEDLGLR